MTANKKVLLTHFSGETNELAWPWTRLGKDSKSLGSQALYINNTSFPLLQSAKNKSTCYPYKGKGKHLAFMESVFQLLSVLLQYNSLDTFLQEVYLALIPGHRTLAISFPASVVLISFCKNGALFGILLLTWFSLARPPCTCHITHGKTFGVLYVAFEQKQHNSSSIDNVSSPLWIFHSTESASSVCPFKIWFQSEKLL